MEIPYLVGEMRLVYRAEPHGSDEKWYINDHCFVIDDEGTLHFIGINNPFPEGGRVDYSVHPFLGHATAKDPFGAWTRHAPAVDDTDGARYLGAPAVLRPEGSDKYTMLFEAVTGEPGDGKYIKHGRRSLELAYSDDLFHWERSRRSAIPHLPEAARDPFFLRRPEGYYLLYLCTPHPSCSTITATKTDDFMKFYDTTTVFSIEDGISWCSTESPFIIERNNLFYLFFTYAHRHYYEERVYVSDTPLAFAQHDIVATLFSHAGEPLEWNGKQYLSSCGPEDTQALNEHGLYLCEMKWTEAAQTAEGGRIVSE